jgi:tetratricopeptide (TPR) repeat protein
MAGTVSLQVIRERWQPRQVVAGGRDLMYVRSPELLARTALSFKSLTADAYWIRALQHYGRSRLSGGAEGKYELLFPLLDLTTSLDPRFVAAYRFGAIFLAEPPPGGPGHPGLAMKLLEKGLQAEPARWEYAQDAGFVHYRSGDYTRAAEWFRRAADIEGAPSWMLPLAAVTEARGGHRSTSRQLWTLIAQGAAPEEEWLRQQAQMRLQQLDALDQIDVLEKLAKVYEQRHGELPWTWADLIRERLLREEPRDPRGFPYQLNPYWGLVTLDPSSALNPLPNESAEP